MEMTAAKYARENPPRLLAPFHLCAVECDTVEEVSDLSVNIACGKCRSETLEVLAYPLTAPDSETYSDVRTGETVWRPPHRARCTACGNTVPLFDPRCHGYDGELGHGSTYECGGELDEERALTSTVSAFRIKLIFTYNIALDELKEIGQEENRSPSDLFDWFTIDCGAPNAEDERALDYECA